jgi:NAD(P)-dependent dehydrogenase (short-subunit alcohol dehydrogenase family)
MSVILITGTSSGHGRYLAEKLGPENTVIAHNRELADLSDLAQVRRLARQVGAVDVLINNAGIGYGTTREVSRDGHELRLAINYLAPVALMRELTIRQRVLNIGSAGQESIDLDDLMMERNYNGIAAYRRAKLALAMATFDFAASRPDLRVNIVHPATFMDTNMVRKGGGTPQTTVAFGGDNTLRVLQSESTGWFFNQDRPSEAHPDAYKPELRARLRALTDELLA